MTMRLEIDSIKESGRKEKCRETKQRLEWAR